MDTDGGGFIDMEEVKQLARSIFSKELTSLELRRAMKEMVCSRAVVQLTALIVTVAGP